MPEMASLLHPGASSTRQRNLERLAAYLRSNERDSVNYGERYRKGLPISSALAESAVNLQSFCDHGVQERPDARPDREGELMPAATPETEHDSAATVLDAHLQLSTELHDAMMDALGMGDSYEVSLPVYGAWTSFLAAELSLEHASGLRMLMATGHPRSAMGSMRMQYEAVVRSAWALWAASDSDIDLLEQDLSLASEAAANQVGQYAKMKEALTASPCPAILLSQLRESDTVSWRALNSYVHGGIHALKRGEEGFPLALALQVIKTSNGLATMAAAMMSKLSGDDRGLAEINLLIPQFMACLPEPRPVSTASA